jgi:hypothetical protein
MNGSKTEHQLSKDETEDYEYVHSKEYVLLKGEGEGVIKIRDCV